ncbi:lipase [uncultured Enterococcus sp.]|uniref:lipase n=1 Tax=uncultured Enterococcus sp. TaxID=167972 RepID=UPI002AA79F1B|nr:lipase [uncultured Enterococcus sp.]
MSTDYEVLKVEDNTDNGMQAMAVAPIVNGKPDTSQVVIAYAGTNQSDSLDIATDAQTVGLGLEELHSFHLFGPTDSVDAQSVTAQQFAESIRNQYPFATITTTGHSLGESLAFFIAAENKWMNVGFNGPYAGSMMSKDAKKWAEDNPGMFYNYRNRYDVIGGALVAGRDFAIIIDVEKDGTLADRVGAYHSLGMWDFDEKTGRLLIPDNEFNEKAIKKRAENDKQKMLGILNSTQSWMKSLRDKLTKSGGGLSANEAIFLDSSEALLVLNAQMNTVNATFSEVESFLRRKTEKAEQAWQKSLDAGRTLGPDLSESEILEALESMGVSKTIISDQPRERNDSKIAEYREIASSCDTLKSEIHGSIEKLLSVDQELATQFQA